MSGPGDMIARNQLRMIAIACLAENTCCRCRELGYTVPILKDNMFGVCDLCMELYLAVHSRKWFRDAQAEYENENKRRIRHKQQVMNPEREGWV